MKCPSCATDREGKRWAERSDDATADGLLETAYSIVANMTGRIEEGVRPALEGGRLLAQAADEEMRALAPWTGTYPLFCAGQLARARDSTEALLESTRGHPEWGFATWTLSALVWSTFMLGQIEIFDGIRDLLSEAGRIIAETGATTLTPLILLDRAELGRLEGETGARRRLLEEARGLFAGLGAPLRVQQIDALLAE